MNQTEAQSLIAYLNRAGLLQALEGQSAVWADAMPEIPFADAQTVVKHLVKIRTSRDRWIVPGDVIEGVKALRRERISWAGAALSQLRAPASLDPDDIHLELEWRRRVREAVGDGHDIDQAAKIAAHAMDLQPDTEEQAIERPRPMAALLSGWNPDVPVRSGPPKDQLNW